MNKIIKNTIFMLVVLLGCGSCNKEELLHEGRIPEDDTKITVVSNLSFHAGVTNPVICNITKSNGESLPYLKLGNFDGGKDSVTYYIDKNQTINLELKLRPISSLIDYYCYFNAKVYRNDTLLYLLNDGYYSISQTHNYNVLIDV